MTDRKTDRCERAIYLVAIFCAVVAVACLLPDRYYLSNALLSCRISGYAALAFLALTLSMASLVRVGNWLGRLTVPATTQSLIVHSGRCAAVLSLIHAGIVVSAYLNFDWPALWQVTYLRSGAAAATILILLLITSFRRINRLVDWQLFKPLHRLIYVAVALVLHHLLLSPFASRWWTLALFSVLAALMTIRLFPQSRHLQRGRQDASGN